MNCSNQHALSNSQISAMNYKSILKRQINSWDSKHINY